MPRNRELIEDLKSSTNFQKTFETIREYEEAEAWTSEELVALLL